MSEPKPPPEPEFTPEEVARRRDEAIRRALNTKPKKQESYKGRPTKPEPK